MDGCAVGLCNPSRDRQTQPGAGLPGARFVRAVEPVENERQVILRNANAGVANSSDGFVAIGLERDGNTASGWRVFDGVVDQDEKQTTQRMGISVDEDRFIGNFAADVNQLGVAKRLAGG